MYVVNSPNTVFRFTAGGLMETPKLFLNGVIFAPPEISTGEDLANMLSPIMEALR